MKLSRTHVILSILTILFLSGDVFLGYQNSNLQKEYGSWKLARSLVTFSAELTPAIQQGSWKTYANADSDISFEYPSSWNLGTTGNSGGPGLFGGEVIQSVSLQKSLSDVPGGILQITMFLETNPKNRTVDSLLNCTKATGGCTTVTYQDQKFISNTDVTGTASNYVAASDSKILYIQTVFTNASPAEREEIKKTLTSIKFIN